MNERIKLIMLDYLLDKFKAVRSPNSVLSGACPPRTYITPSTRTAACCVREDGMDPVHCSSVHFRVEILNDQVSFKLCRPV
jgi:hypothetical protein